MLTPSRLKGLLREIARARIGVVGDFCVDSYCSIDLAASEPSLETGVATWPVREQRQSLGGAGNVVANLHALGVGAIKVFGVVGRDAFAAELRRLLDRLGVETTGLIEQREGWQTHAYLKPMLGREESHRLDFGLFNVLDPKSAVALLSALSAAAHEIDVLVINQQFKNGIHTPALQEGLNAVLKENRKLLALVDCRDLAEAYPFASHKLNDLEATRLCGSAHAPGEKICRQEVVDSGRRLHARWQHPLFVTRGAYGCIAFDQDGTHEIPGLHLIKKTDPVGAGDSMVAGLAACLAIGASPEEAATFGNFVAGVTVQKLEQTGTASPAEVREIGEHPDYVYNAELAEDLRGASYLSGTAIEIVEALPPDLDVRFAVFDHDGTISTLRQGWEAIMEPMMIKAILGPAADTVDRAVYDAVGRQVREFIDQTTGIQTLQQMHGLSLMAREAGFVPEPHLLDAAGYKRIYNDALIGLVEARKARLRSGELDVEDFTVKNAVKLLHALHDGGIRLFLASGTDEQDVVLEAEALGYAPLFEGRIYGAGHDLAHDAKRMVLDRILDEIGAPNAGHIVTFGDGPVEIRETRKRGGIAVGVASDEIRRFGLRPEKRTRVVRAGAHVVVPDYSQLGALLEFLGIGAKAAA